jgi:hypothetical protein
MPASNEPTATTAITVTSAASRAPRQAKAAPAARKNKVRVIISIDPDLLAALDDVAARKGLSRAGTMSLACADLIDREQQRIKSR